MAEIDLGKIGYPLKNDATTETPGEFALDAAMAKELNDKIDASNLRFANPIKIVAATASVTMAANKSQAISVQVDIPEGYNLAGCVGFSINSFYIQFDSMYKYSSSIIRFDIRNATEDPIDVVITAQALLLKS